MILPLKFNQETLPPRLRTWLPCRADPRKLIVDSRSAEVFERRITAIKIGPTWKSTRRQRHPLTDQMIMDIVSSREQPIILDVGASSGSTSLDLLARIQDNFARYYVTDICFHLQWVSRGAFTYFYYPLTEECIMAVTDWFLFYNDLAGALFPLGPIVKRLFTHAPPMDPVQASALSLLHPELRQRVEDDPRIVVEEYSFLDPWPHESVDIIKVANVLNRNYFTDDTIAEALRNLAGALKPGGHLVVTDNRSLECVSVFTKAVAGLALCKSLNGGSDIANLVTGL